MGDKKEFDEAYFRFPSCPSGVQRVLQFDLKVMPIRNQIIREIRILSLCLICLFV